MATLRSLYSDEVAADVPNDLLPPKPPVLTGQAQQCQQDDGVTHGRSLVTLNWTAPTENEDIGGEFLITATGGAQSTETVYDPVIAGPEVYEMSNFGGAGRGDTTLAAQADQKDLQITVNDATNFVPGDWIQLEESGIKEYVKIASILGSVLTLETRVMGTTFPITTTTVKEADAVLKTVTTDYTIVLATGVVTIVAGQFTASNDIAIKYTTTLQDLDGYTLLRNPVLMADTAYENVILDGSTVTASDAIGSGATTFQDTLSAAENGETWYYYLYAKDDETPANRSLVASGGPLLVETIPSIPQNLGKTVGDQAVQLTWDSIGPGGSDANTDGYNVYRNPGGTLDQANLLQLNASLVAKATLEFKDSQDGIDDLSRVPAGTVQLPINGQSYTYVLEAEDTATGWTTGTQNQKQGQGAVTIAEKTP